MSYMHKYRTYQVGDALDRAGIEEFISDRKIDNAIQAAVEKITTDSGTRPNPDNDEHWFTEILPTTLYFLDLEYDEVYPVGE